MCTFLLITIYGKGALRLAEEWMQERMDVDDAKGASIWLGVCGAIRNASETEQEEHLH